MTSSVATSFRLGGIYNECFIANFLLNVSVKYFENQSIFGEDMDNSWVSCFLTHSVLLTSGMHFHLR